MAANIYECFIDSVVRGHHNYKTIWNPLVGEVLNKRKNLNKSETQLKAAAFIRGQHL